MKIYERLVIQDGVVVEEVSYEYEGEVAQCGGGGGSASGQIGYPAYVETIHSLYLSHGATDVPLYSMNDLMNVIWTGVNPYTAVDAYDPDVALTAMATAIADVQTLVTNLSDVAWIDANVAAFSADLDIQLNGVVYPKFEAGMRDIGAVSSSAFVLGRALIADGKLREVAKYTAGLNTSLIELRLKWQMTVAEMSVNVEKDRIATKVDQTETDAEFNVKEALFHIEAYQYAANMLSAPSGGSVVNKGASKASRAFGGALAGGASGAMGGYLLAGAATGGMSGPVGAMVGGAVGLAMGIGSAFM